MKQKDIALIAVIVFVSAIFSLFISKAIFGSPAAADTKAEIVSPITADFPTPDSTYFNNQAIDPTKTITIQQYSTTDPFSNTTAAN
ncbi:MAG: hypothetical protein ABIV43_00050 [Candidatus Saccharimonadales bacterium]